MDRTRLNCLMPTLVVCFAIGLVLQSGCRKETADSGVAKVAKASIEAPTSEASHEIAASAAKAVEIPTDPESTTNVVAPKPPEFVNANFEAPFRLMVDDNPLNTAAKQMYPSPAMYDVDNDGQVELIVGDIFGSLNVYENKNSDSGDPVWNTHYALKTGAGEAIKVSNW